MRRRTLLLLGGAAAATVAVAVLLTPRGVERQEIAGGSLAFPGLATRLPAAERVEVRRAEGTLVLARQGEAWVLPEKAGYPIRTERLREVLVGLTELRLAEPRTADPAQYGRLGVDDPDRPGSKAVLLRVLDGAGAPLAELILGQRRVRTGGNAPESLYVRRPFEAQAWLAEGRLAVEADPQLWIDRDVANLPADRVRRAEFHRGEEPALVLARGSGPDAKLQVEQPAGAPPTDEVALEEIARGLEFLTFTEVRPAAAMPGEALGEARYTLDGNIAVTVRTHQDGGDLWVALRAEGGEEAARLDARWQPWAYQVGAWKRKAFAPRLDDLRPREAPAPPAAPR